MAAKFPYSFVHTDQTQAIAPDRSSVESAAVIHDSSNDPFTSSL